MKLLGIETSCDETALSIIEAEGDLKSPVFKVLADSVLSQIKIHKEYGGVFPALAKREHSKALAPLLKTTLEKASLYSPAEKAQEMPEAELKKILEREPGLFDELIKILREIKKPEIDAIGVTRGPGLEPALWVGINFAKALSTAWNMPIIPVNHMEGHILSVIAETSKETASVEFPAIALLISGGHTELVLVKNWTDYEIIGETRDDAVGEAFDKTARMLGLPYPGGPEISKLAETERQENPKSENKWKLPRPMLHTHDFDFSFSGLKTAVLYTLKKIEKITPKIKQEIGRDFEDAVTEVLVSKTRKALEKYGAQSLILGGGVTSNKMIRKSFENLAKDFSGLNLFLPTSKLSTDNALMIAVATYIRIIKSPELLKNRELDFEAKGNLRL